MTIRQVAREAATGAQATAPVDECHAIADAVAQAVLREVLTLQRIEGYSCVRMIDPNDVRDLRAAFTTEPK